MASLENCIKHSQRNYNRVYNPPVLLQKTSKRKKQSQGLSIKLMPKPKSIKEKKAIEKNP